MKFLSAKDIIFINEEVVDESGGSIGIRDFGLIDSAANRPRASFGGEDLYPSLFLKAAALFHSIIFNHAFLDGNKRTSIAAVEVFLGINKYQLKASQKEKEDFVMSIVEEKLEVEQIAQWLEKNSKKLE
jgi:death on curing protein